MLWLLCVLIVCCSGERLDVKDRPWVEQQVKRFRTDFLIARVDKDNDGFFSQPELDAFRKTFDLNEDGVIRGCEFVTEVRLTYNCTPGVANFLLDRIDTNRDDVITQDFQVTVDSLDTNKDGKVSATEFRVAIVDGVRAAANLQWNALMGAVKVDSELKPAYTFENWMNVTQNADKTGDGYISIDDQLIVPSFNRCRFVDTHNEWYQQPKWFFHRLFDVLNPDEDEVLRNEDVLRMGYEADTNGDGRCSTAEFSRYLLSSFRRARWEAGAAFSSVPFSCPGQKNAVNGDADQMTIDVDLNSDGKITGPELAIGTLRLYDINQDNVVSRIEFEEKAIKRYGLHLTQAGKFFDIADRSGDNVFKLKDDELYFSFDANSNGVITYCEFKAWIVRNLDKANN